MFDPIKKALIRFGRYAVSILIAYCLYLLINALTSIPVPHIIAPLVTAIIVAISKYIRDVLKVQLPF